MGNKFEYLSASIFIVLMILTGIFVACAWGTAITDNNYREFEIEDNIIVINGTIDSIDLIRSEKDDYTPHLKVDGKVYEVSEYMDSFYGSERDESLELLYYTVEIGDNITIYETCRIVLNGNVYQEGVFDDFFWFAWVITFIPVVIVVLLLVIYLAYFVGYGNRVLKKDLKSRDRKVRDLREDLTRAKEQYNRWKKDYTQKTEQQKNPNPLYKLIHTYCNNCGSIVDITKSHCSYCGSEVRLE